MLVEQFRYDVVRQELGDGRQVTNFGCNKGLEIIPADRVEIFLAVPPYMSRNFGGTSDGVGDFFWLMKYRLASGNEQHGNYVVTAFLAGTVPTATNGNGAPHVTLAPTLAYGKGWGNLDLQGTIGVSAPLAETSKLGTPVAWNNAFQYHVMKKLWPEIELNATFFPNGPNGGSKQLFVTPGLVVGRFALTRRVGLAFGAGVQVAATHFHTSNHNLILSVRLPF